MGEEFGLHVSVEALARRGRQVLYIIIVIYVHVHKLTFLFNQLLACRNVTLNNVCR